MFGINAKADLRLAHMPRARRIQDSPARRFMEYVLGGGLQRREDGGDVYPRRIKAIYGESFSTEGSVAD